MRVSGTGVGVLYTVHCTAPTLTKLGKCYPMRPKAREMTQHGGPAWLAGWRRVTQPDDIYVVMDCPGPLS